jgi:hypothetical protein
MAEHSTAERFTEAMLNLYDRAKQECRYYATDFRGMVYEYGGCGAAERLLTSDSSVTGLTPLWECGRLDLSMEALILRPEWEPLFSDEQRAIARQRLTEFGYEPPE